MSWDMLRLGGVILVEGVCLLGVCGRTKNYWGEKLWQGQQMFTWAWVQNDPLKLISRNKTPF